MRPQKRRKKSAAARLRPFWILIVMLVIAAGAGAYYAAAWPGFYPRTLTVTGNRSVSAHEIALRAAIAAHTNLWLQSMRAAADRVAAIPAIKDVRIYRALPAQVTVAVTERVPFAVVDFANGEALVDRDLRVLAIGPQIGPEFSGPAFVTRSPLEPRVGAFLKDPALMRLRQDYAALAAAHVALRSLGFDRFGDLTGRTSGGIRLLLGEDADLAQKAPLIDPIVSQVAASGRKLSTLDLRAPKTPVVVYRDK